MKEEKKCNAKREQQIRQHQHQLTHRTDINSARWDAFSALVQFSDFNRYFIYFLVDVVHFSFLFSILFVLSFSSLQNKSQPSIIFIIPIHAFHTTAILYALFSIAEQSCAQVQLCTYCFFFACLCVHFHANQHHLEAATNSLCACTKKKSLYWLNSRKTYNNVCII